MKVANTFGRAGLRLFVKGCLVILRLLPRVREPSQGPKHLLLTGTFFSENWILNHIRPLLGSAQCKKVTLICTFPVPGLSKLEVLRPPKVLLIMFGRTPGRLLYFCFQAFFRRPDVLGGFHISLNGLIAAVLARLIRAQSLYFCGGGPREVLGGGFYAGNNSMDLGSPDLKLESLLLKCVSEIDLVITMGSRTISFFKGRGVNTRFEVIAGGIDTAVFSDGGIVAKEFEIIFVGRLVQVKRIDLLLDAVESLGKQGVRASLAIVGTGELEDALKERAKALKIQDRVTFAGHQTKVSDWLRRSRIFVLASDSEGLSLALMEAMCCGLPAVVSDVGELGELVEDGKNGYLVKERTGEAFANALVKVLKNDVFYAELAENASANAAGLRIEGAIRSWDRVLTGRPLACDAGRKEVPTEVGGTTPACGVQEQ